MEWNILFQLNLICKRSLATLVLSTALAACATGPTQHPNDPLEPMNRAVHGFNQKADRYVLKPVAEGYKTVTPEPVRIGVSNVFNNLGDVLNLANHTLQFKGERALKDLLRVAFNTVFGLGGLIDIATPMGLEREAAGFGDTLAHYGYKDSSYLVLPLLGPSTVRDAIGTGVDFAASPNQAILSDPASRNSATGLNMVNRRATVLGSEQLIDEASLDSYSFTRDAWLQIRNKKIGNTQAEDSDLNINDLVPAEPAQK